MQTIQETMSCQPSESKLAYRTCFSSLSYYGHIPYYEGFSVGIGSLIGVVIANYAMTKIDSKLQKKLLVIIYFIIIITMFLKPAT